MLRHAIATALMITSMTATADSFTRECARANGFRAIPDVSVNDAEFKTQYERNPELWNKVFRFLAETDLASLPTGNIDIEPGKCWVSVSEYTPRGAENVKIESHRKYTDLQYTLSGNEKMGLARDVKPGVVMEYSAPRDVAFWTSEVVDYYPATKDNFFVFFPEDLHQPSVLDGEPAVSKKIVVKIPYIE